MRGLLVAATLLVVAGCDGMARAPEPAPTVSTSRPTETWTFPVSIRPDRAPYTVTLEAAAPDSDDAVVISGLEIRSQDGSEPVQIVRDLTAQPSRAALESGAAFEVLDMNFDGFADFRFIDIVPAGPNVLYSHWLYRPESGRFDRSPALDALASPSFDPDSRRVTSTARTSAAEYVTEIYEFSGDRLILVGELLKSYSEPGSYRLTVRELVDGRMRTTEERQVDEH